MVLSFISTLVYGPWLNPFLPFQSDINLKQIHFENTFCHFILHTASQHAPTHQANYQ